MEYPEPDKLLLTLSPEAVEHLIQLPDVLAGVADGRVMHKPEHCDLCAEIVREFELCVRESG